MKRLSSLLLILPISLLAINPVFAATVHGLVVSYYDTYDNSIPAKQVAIEENIKNLADAIYEMSNGAQKLGQVTIYTDAAYKDRADVIWEKNIGDTGQLCWFNAYVSGRLREKGPYKRIQHCDIGRDYPHYNTLDNPKTGGYTLAHEWGHYFLGLYDEYAQGPTSSDNPGTPLSTDTAVPNSLMNDTTNALQGDYTWLNLSTDLNNKGNNAQFRMYGASGWNTIVRPPEQDPATAGRRPYYPELAAVVPPTGQTPSIELTSAEAQAVARSDLKIEWKRGSEAPATRSNGSSNTVSTVRQVIVDLSTHLSTNELENVKDALQQWVGHANEGDFIGIVGFADTVTVIQPLVKIESAATKATIMASIGNMTAMGSSAVLGDALQSTLQQFRANNAPEDLVWAIYLFGSGQSHGEVAPLSVLSAFKEEDVMLHVLDLGAKEQGNDLLQQLAATTGGEYWLAEGIEDLMSGLNNADEATSPTVDTLIKIGANQITGNQDFSFYVDSSIVEVSVDIAYSGQLEDTTVTLVDPQNNNYAFNLVEDCETTFDEAENSAIFCGLEIRSAPAGMWTLKAVANVANTAILYSVTGIPQENDKTFFASVDSVYGEELVSPQPMILVASVGKDFPITDLAIEGIIELPNGTFQDLTWRDDGVAPDSMARDGLYTTQFNYTQSGDYYVVAGFNNHAATAQFTNYGASYAFDLSGASAASTSPVGENFERFADLQITVTVNDGNPLPILEDSVKGFSLSIDQQGNFNKPNAQFSGGVAVEGSSFVAMATATSQQTVAIKANIKVVPADVGKVADLLVVRGVESPPAPYDGGDALYYASNHQGMLTPVDLYASVDVWMAQLTEPFQAGVTLQDTVPVDLWTGPLEGPAMYYFFVGYRLAEGTIIYNARPVMVEIQ